MITGIHSKTTSGRAGSNDYVMQNTLQTVKNCLANTELHLPARESVGSIPRRPGEGREKRCEQREGVKGAGHPIQIIGVRRPKGIITHTLNSSVLLSVNSLSVTKQHDPRHLRDRWRKKTCNTNAPQCILCAKKICSNFAASFGNFEFLFFLVACFFWFFNSFCVIMPGALNTVLTHWLSVEGPPPEEATIDLARWMLAATLVITAGLVSDAHACTHARTHARTRTHTHTCAPYTHTRTHRHTRTHAHNTHTYHTHAQLCTQTRTRTHKYTFTQQTTNTKHNTDLCRHTYYMRHITFAKVHATQNLMQLHGMTCVGLLASQAPDPPARTHFRYVVSLCRGNLLALFFAPACFHPHTMQLFHLPDH